jgi:hypothetical protein
VNGAWAKTNPALKTVTYESIGRPSTGWEENDCRGCDTFDGHPVRFPDKSTLSFSFTISTLTA